MITGKIKVTLFDKRSDSITRNEKVEFYAGNEDPVAYFFPPGVFHGYKCMEGPMHIVYVTSGTYDIDDELREDIGDYIF